MCRGLYKFSSINERQAFFYLYLLYLFFHYSLWPLSRVHKVFPLTIGSTAKPSNPFWIAKGDSFFKAPLSEDPMTRNLGQDFKEITSVWIIFRVPSKVNVPSIVLLKEFSLSIRNVKHVTAKNFIPVAYSCQVAWYEHKFTSADDHNLVKLLPIDEDDNSDYINANFIPGYNSPREYIATQGPQDSTINDFWRMIWERNVPIIVMLTGVKEGMKHKCALYWPEDLHVTSQYGDIMITLEDKKTFTTSTLKTFKLCLVRTWY
ncbi:tyrosine-protein phosphatase 69D-like [Gigantopelta aegis]|uniref:tyrosine-protein phosphatase 69D-like n=1 Tax=Gigantopelta aegis TaxID=1735272 RepID=UPI001B88832E|nr:tyrosine-protein phosphatase 69D-like [Gigantopelta aegis]